MLPAKNVRKYDSLLHALAIGGSALDARDERLLSGRAFFGTGELPSPPKHYFAQAVAPGSDEKPKKPEMSPELKAIKEKTDDEVRDRRETQPQWPEVLRS